MYPSSPSSIPFLPFPHVGGGGGRPMAGGTFLAEAAGGDQREVDVKLSVPVIATCLMAASGGLIFGYDIGISGGVTTMKPFLAKFFPDVLRRIIEAETNQYCIYDSQVLTAFTSSLYIAGLASALFAGHVTRALGRRGVMLVGGLSFLTGATINAAAVNMEMLILGRILLGFGVGFTNQATPLYLSEVAPPRWRGALGAAFQLFNGIGVVAANLTNYAVAARGVPWGWRLSLGLAAAPALALLLGALLIPDSPSALLARGDVPAARAALRRLRGPHADVDLELAELARSMEEAKRTEGKGGRGPYRRMVGRGYRHHLVMAVGIPVFQQMTGVNVVAFYGPVLFGAVGFGSNAALMAAVILGAVNLTSIAVSMALVDRYGRRALFFAGGAQMFVCQVAMACIMGTQLGNDGTATMAHPYAWAVLAFTCLYCAGFGWSWGPLSWVVPAEIFPPEVRSAGQSINIALNLGVIFVSAQTFLAMLCRLKYGVFAFYAGWIVAMTVFVAALLPETKGVALEDMEKVWEGHWLWRRYHVRYEEMK